MKPRVRASSAVSARSDRSKVRTPPDRVVAASASRGENPRVHAVLFDQHDRLLARRYIHRHLDRLLGGDRRGAAAPHAGDRCGFGGRRQFDPIDDLEIGSRQSGRQVWTSTGRPRSEPDRLGGPSVRVEPFRSRG